MLCNAKPEEDQITGPDDFTSSVDKVTVHCQCELPAEDPHDLHRCKGCPAVWENRAYSSHERDLARALGVE